MRRVLARSAFFTILGMAPPRRVPCLDHISFIVGKRSSASCSSMRAASARVVVFMAGLPLAALRYRRARR
jgi:hypothetical protein